MADSYTRILKQAEQTQECLEDMEQLTPLLPQSTEEIDALLDRLASNHHVQEFYTVLFAALIAGHQPDVEVLRRHPDILRRYGLLAAFVPRMGGDKVGYLLWVARQTRWLPVIRTVAAIALMGWLHHDEERVTKEVLLEIYRNIVPDLRMHVSIDSHNRQDNALHVCALAMALGEPLPLDFMSIKVRGKRKGKSGQEAIAAVELKAQEMLANYTRHSQLQANLLLPPTRAQIKPETKPVKAVRRSEAKVGRNDPCPCGSGRKYKKCCRGQAERPAPDDPPKPQPPIDLKSINDRPIEELAQLDFPTLPTELHGPLAHRLASQYSFTALTRLLKAVPLTEDLLAACRRAIGNTASFDETDHLHQLAALLPEGELKDLPKLLHAKLALVDSALTPQAEVLENELSRVLDSPTDIADLAINLLQWKMPALGTIVARGALASGVDARYAAGLQVQLKGTRRRLGLAGPDCADTLAQKIIDDDHEQSELSAAVIELQSQVRRARQKSEKRQAEIARQEAEIEQLSQELKRQPTATTQAPPDRTRLERRLARAREHVDQLQQERRTLTEELNDSRSKLATREAELAAIDAQQAHQEAQEERLLGESISGPQPLRIPAYPDNFLAILKKFPDKVQREALHVIGKLAAGFDHGWAGTRKLELRPDHFRQKVKQDHRVIFRFSDHTLTIIDLIDRRDLERRIESL